MKAAPIPRNESRRVDALLGLNLLDTPPEERFDRLTRLARRLFDVPVALISLVDSDRQWFKSKVGLDCESLDRETSFCGHAIMRDGAFVVRDALDDDRFADNPLVTGPLSIRFYAGIPLASPSGNLVGTFCIIDHKPRDLDEEDKALLRDLASIAEHELSTVHLLSMDDLTGLSNRRGFLALGQHALSTCKRLERPGTLLFFDLDGFKLINDRHGHAEGDRALAVFAGHLMDNFRESDVIGRLGGDEFAVFLTGAQKEAADPSMARLQAALDAYEEQAQRGYRIRYSFGKAALDPQRHNRVEQLLEEADARMYQHKAARKSAR